MINWNNYDIEEKEGLTNNQLVNFLQKNNVYDSFIYNIKHYNFLDCISIETFCDVFEKNFYINSFSWKFSKEGFNYWLNLNIKWIQSLNK
jgi:hypothetical protein